MPHHLRSGLVLMLKPELPAKSSCRCYVLARILAQIWMDLAGLAAEENQVETSIILSLFLTGRSNSISFSDMKEAAKKQRFTSVEA